MKHPKTIIKLNNRESDPLDEKSLSINKQLLEEAGYTVHHVIQDETFEDVLNSFPDYSVIVWNYGTSVYRPKHLEAPWEILKRCKQYEIKHPLSLHALTLHKNKTTELAASVGVNVPEQIMTNTENATLPKNYPCVLKPNAAWGSIGVTYHENPETLQQAIDDLHQQDIHEIIIEQFIPGDEYFVTTFAYPDQEPFYIKPLQMTITEGSPIFTQDDKHKQQQDRYHRRLGENEKLNQEVFQEALKVHRALGGTGLLRSEFKYHNDKFYYLETNGKPGLSPGSSLSQAWQQTTGRSHLELLQEILEGAVKYQDQQNQAN